MAKDFTTWSREKMSISEEIAEKTDPGSLKVEEKLSWHDTLLISSVICSALLWIPLSPVFTTLKTHLQKFVPIAGLGFLKPILDLAKAFHS